MIVILYIVTTIRVINTRIIEYNIYFCQDEFLIKFWAFELVLNVVFINFGKKYSQILSQKLSFKIISDDKAFIFCKSGGKINFGY